MSLEEWTIETEKCIASRTTFEWKTGGMTVEFRTYLKEHNFSRKYVKPLLKISSVENRIVMLKTINVLADDIRSEYAQAMNDAEKQFEEIDNKYLFVSEREKAKTPIRKKRDARRKSLNTKFKKLLDLKALIEGC